MSLNLLRINASVGGSRMTRLALVDQLLFSGTDASVTKILTKKTLMTTLTWLGHGMTSRFQTALQTMRILNL